MPAIRLLVRPSTQSHAFPSRPAPMPGARRSKYQPVSPDESQNENRSATRTRSCWSSRWRLSLPAAQRARQTRAAARFNPSGAVRSARPPAFGNRQALLARKLPQYRCQEPCGRWDRRKARRLHMGRGIELTERSDSTCGRKPCPPSGPSKRPTAWQMVGSPWRPPSSLGVSLSSDEACQTT